MFQDDTIRALTINIRWRQVICCLKKDHSMYSWTQGSSSAPYADSGTSHGKGNGMFLSFSALSPSSVKTGSFICTNKWCFIYYTQTYFSCTSCYNCCQGKMANESVEITNKMQPCNRIYYSKIYWRLNTFRAAHHSSSGAPNYIYSLWFIYCNKVLPYCSI
jgi:hypothetical protein